MLCKELGCLTTFKTIRELCQKGHILEALHVVGSSNQQGVPLSTSLLSQLLRGCINRKNVKLGREVHCMIVRRGLESNLFLASCLIRLFAVCGNLLDANKVFSTLPNSDVFVWSAIVLAHAKFGQGEQAIKLYHLMLQRQIVKPDAHTFVAVLKACSTITALNEGKFVHANAVEDNVELVVHVGNTLIDMYIKCGSLDDAQAVFEKMLERDVVTWNSMIAGYSHNGHDQKAHELCQRMQKEGIKPDSVTFLNILKAFPDSEVGHKGDSTFSHVRDCGYGMGIHHGANCWRLDDVRRLFDKLPNRSLAAWTAMIARYAEDGYRDKALHLYTQLLREEGLQPDNVAFVCALKGCTNIDMVKSIHTHIIESGCELDLHLGNCLIDMYGKCGGLEDARRLFDDVHRRCVVTWSAMIAAYVHHGQDQDSLELFYRMLQDGIEPNEVTYFCAMKACSNMAALVHSFLIHAHIVVNGRDLDIQVGNAVIDMYAKCWSLQDARRMFDQMQNRSVVTWSAMIAAYAQHNRHELSLECFNDMVQEGAKPNSVTFVCLLSACYHLGLVNQGCYHFYTMEKNYGVTPTNEHHNCMVELLGRAGRLEEAADLLQGMPGGSNIVAWVSLLNQCKIHGNMDLAKRCFDNIVIMDPKDASGYMLMSNLYADFGMCEFVDRLQNIRKYASIHKKLGKACVEVDTVVHDFVAGDRSHPQIDGIYERLKRLEFQVKGEGYMPYVNLVMQPWSDKSNGNNLSAFDSAELLI